MTPEDKFRLRIQIAQLILGVEEERKTQGEEPLTALDLACLNHHFSLKLGLTEDAASYRDWIKEREPEFFRKQEVFT